MKIQHKILAVLILLLAISFRLIPEKVVLQGQLLAAEGKVKEPWWQLKAMVRTGNRVLATAHVDEISGKFTLEWSPEENTKYDLFVTGNDKDTSFIRSFDTFGNDTITHYFLFPVLDLDKRK